MKNEVQISIINKIRRLREAKGFSQARLAAELDLTDGHIGNIESIKSPHKYTLSQIYDISKLFNVPIEDIFFDDSFDKNEIIDLLIKKIIDYEK